MTLAQAGNVLAAVSHAGVEVGHRLRCGGFGFGLDRIDRGLQVRFTARSQRSNGLRTLPVDVGQVLEAVRGRRRDFVTAGDGGRRSGLERGCGLASRIGDAGVGGDDSRLLLVE